MTGVAVVEMVAVLHGLVAAALSGVRPRLVFRQPGGGVVLVSVTILGAIDGAII